MSTSNKDLLKIPFAKTPMTFSGERFISGCFGEIEHEHYHRYLFALQVCANKTVLDIACGDGYGSALLSSVAEHVTGVDISEEAVLAASENYGNNKLDYRHGSCTAIPLESSSVDVIISFETIEHFKDHTKFMSEVKRVLRPNGLLLISSPDRDIYSAPGKQPNPYHIKELTRDDFISLISNSFSNIEVLEQKATAGSVIVPVSDSKSRKEGDFETFFHTGERIFHRGKQLHDAVYLLIQASDAELPCLNWGLHDDSLYSEFILKELAARTEDLKRTEEELSNEVKRHKASATTFSEVRNNLETLLQDMKQKLELSTEDLRKTEKELSDEIERHKASATTFSEVRNHLETLLQDMKQKIEMLGHDVIKSKNEVRDCNIQIEQLEKTIHELRTSLFSSDIKIQTMNKQLADEKNQSFALLCNKNVLTAKLEKSMLETSTLTKEIQAIRSSKIFKLKKVASTIKNRVCNFQWYKDVCSYILCFPSRLISLNLISRLKQRKLIQTIKESGLFYESYYISQCQEIKETSIDPVLHYLLNGAFQGYNPHPLFDSAYYLEQNPDVLSSGVNPLVHFLQIGGKEGRHPHPLFDTSYYCETKNIPSLSNPLLDYIQTGGTHDPHPLFSRKYYLEQSPEAQNSGQSPLAHFILEGAKKAYSPHPWFNISYYLSQLNNFDLEKENPLCHYHVKGWRQYLNPHPNFNTKFYLETYPDVSSVNINPLVHYIRWGIAEGRATKSLETDGVDWTLERALVNLLADIKEKAKGMTYSHFIVLPFLTLGGADLTAMNYARAIVEKRISTRVLIIIADTSKVEISLNNTERVDVLVLDTYRPLYTLAERAYLLESLIHALRPEVIHNVNSEVLWRLIVEKGEKLSKISKLFGSIFAFQFGENGEKIGYAAQFFEKSFPFLSGLIADNQRFLRDAIAEYKVTDGQNKLHVVYNPSRVPDLQVVKSFPVQEKDRGEKHSFNVLWAGRFDREKKLDVLIEIAKLSSFATFHLYGKQVVDKSVGVEIPELQNLFVHKPFSNPQELQEEISFNAFVFTSKWEGLPNILLEIGSLGIPIIAPNVGGVSELISSDTGYLVSAEHKPAEFISALRDIKTNPEEAQTRANNLRLLIQQRHSWNHFCRQLWEIVDYL